MMGRTILAVCATAIVLAACAVQPKEMYTATGQKGYAIDCVPRIQNAGRQLQAQGTEEARNAVAMTPPPQPNWATCYQHASNMCGARGYDVLDRQQHGTMTIQCKGQ